MIRPVIHGRAFTGQNIKFAIHEITERLARRIDVFAVAIDEIHRHIEHVVDIAFKAKTVLEHERQHATTIRIGIGPDV